jgi:hypothetical protein
MRRPAHARARLARQRRGRIATAAAYTAMSLALAAVTFVMTISLYNL